jgi:diguanylate cyclase
MSLLREITSAPHQRLRLSASALAAAFLVATCGSVLQIGDPSVYDGHAAGTLDTLDASAQDAILRTRAPESFLDTSASRNPSADPRAFITIVAIDERTVSELGAYNGGYERRYHAQVIENLLLAPPRVIALDLGFFEPTADDDLLAAAIDHARELPTPTSVILGAVGTNSSASASPSRSSGELSFDHELIPVPVLAQRADIALANMFPDQRGVVRSVPLLASVGGIERPTLGLAAIARYLRRPSFTDGRPDPGSLALAGRLIPVDASTSALRINFFGAPSRTYDQNATFRVISFVDVLRERVDPAVWRGGLVFVGALGAAGLADDYWTPVSNRTGKMAGVEIQANVAATLVSAEFVHELPPVYTFGVIFGLAVLIALLVANLGLGAACLLSLASLGIYAAGSGWMLYERGWLVPFAAPLLTGMACLVGTLATRVVTERRHQATHDGLTGLPNRLQLFDRVRAGIGTAQRAGTAAAVLVLDLDRFKDINDTLGHQLGDALLKQVADRLHAALPASETVARLGGDEFGVLLVTADTAAATAMAAQLGRALSRPFTLADQEFSIAASIGIAIYPEHGDSAHTLLRRAELAMYAAKQARPACVVYTPDLDSLSAGRLALMTALPRAIEAGELILYCQPKVDCQSGQPVGVEALVRWQHPQLGLLLPDSFIKLAEEMGLIGQLTHWVLGAAIRQARSWLDAGIDMPVAINLSGRDFEDPELPQRVLELLETWRVPARLVSLEITESAVVAHPARALDVLRRLDGIGVRASLDDFGTGYSSLSAIRQLPLHELKIDRSFVHDMVISARDRAIVESTIELGHSLGLSVVAEGVEDAATFALLAGLGCDLAQGYLFARPMPAEDLVTWIADAGQPSAAEVSAVA